MKQLQDPEFVGKLDDAMKHLSDDEARGAGRQAPVGAPHAMAAPSPAATAPGSHLAQISCPSSFSRSHRTSQALAVRPAPPETAAEAPVAGEVPPPPRARLVPVATRRWTLRWLRRSRWGLQRGRAAAVLACRLPPLRCTCPAAVRVVQGHGGHGPRCGVGDGGGRDEEADGGHGGHVAAGGLRGGDGQPDAPAGGQGHYAGAGQEDLRQGAYASHTVPTLQRGEGCARKASRRRSLYAYSPLPPSPPSSPSGWRRTRACCRRRTTSGAGATHADAVIARHLPLTAFPSARDQLRQAVRLLSAAGRSVRDGAGEPRAGDGAAAGGESRTLLCRRRRVTPLRLLQMQETGAPPESIIKELAPGLEFGPDGMPVLPNMVRGRSACPRLFGRPADACGIAGASLAPACSRCGRVPAVASKGARSVEEFVSSPSPLRR